MLKQRSYWQIFWAIIETSRRLLIMRKSWQQKTKSVYMIYEKRNRECVTLKAKASESEGLAHLCLRLWFEERTYATWKRVYHTDGCASGRLTVVTQEEHLQNRGAFVMNCSAVCLPEGPESFILKSKYESEINTHTDERLAKTKLKMSRYLQALIRIDEVPAR